MILNFLSLYFKVVFYWDQPFSVAFGWDVLSRLWVKPLLIILFDQIFQPAQSFVEMVENDG